MNRPNSSDRYEPLVQMAREMAVDTGVPAQTHFDTLLDLMGGPGLLRRLGWFVERNRKPLLLVSMLAATIAAHLAF